ncbi:MAG: MFS transporter [Limnothrix sp. RL_2_0]|nr:MFS transporter [Limnothrix sp. RL_2_0]
MHDQSVAKNIRILWLLKGLSSAWFPIPILMIFYQSYGLSLAQGVMLKAILSGAFFLGEIPSGYFADRIGRKTSLVCGSLLWLLAWLIYCTQGSWSWFVGAEILTGIGGSLMSGADSAITYDTLLQLGRTAEYQGWEGKGLAIMGLTEAACGLVGAWVATQNLVYPFYLQTACLCCYVVLALMLREPTAHCSQVNPPWRSLTGSIRTIFTQRPSLRWLILFSATLSCGSFLIVWLSQEYMVQRGLELTHLGWAWVIFHSAMAIASSLVGRIRPRDYRWIFALLPCVVAIAYIGLGVTKSLWGMGFIIAIYMMRGLNTPLVLNYLNQQIPSNFRATLISINSFLFRLLFLGFAPLVSLVSRGSGFETSLIFAGLLLGIVATYAYYKLRPTL